MRNTFNQQVEAISEVSGRDIAINVVRWNRNPPRVIRKRSTNWPKEADQDRPSARMEAKVGKPNEENSYSAGLSGESWAEHFKRGGDYDRKSGTLLTPEEARLRRKQALIIL